MKERFIYLSHRDKNFGDLFRSFLNHGDIVEDTLFTFSIKSGQFSASFCVYFHPFQTVYRIKTVDFSGDIQCEPFQVSNWGRRQFDPRGRTMLQGHRKRRRPEVATQKSSGKKERWWWAEVGKLKAMFMNRYVQLTSSSTCVHSGLLLLCFTISLGQLLHICPHGDLVLLSLP